MGENALDTSKSPYSSELFSLGHTPVNWDEIAQIIPTPTNLLSDSSYDTHTSELGWYGIALITFNTHITKTHVTLIYMQTHKYPPIV